MNINIDPRFNVLLENVEYNSFAIEVAEVIDGILRNEKISAGEKGLWFSLKQDMLRAVELNRLIGHVWMQDKLDFWGLSY